MSYSLREKQCNIIHFRGTLKFQKNQLPRSQKLKSHRVKIHTLTTSGHRHTLSRNPLRQSHEQQEQGPKRDGATTVGVHRAGPWEWMHGRQSPGTCGVRALKAAPMPFFSQSEGAREAWRCLLGCVDSKAPQEVGSN